MALWLRHVPDLLDFLQMTCGGWSNHPTWAWMESACHASPVVVYLCWGIAALFAYAAIALPSLVLARCNRRLAWLMPFLAPVVVAMAGMIVMPLIWPWESSGLQASVDALFSADGYFRAPPNSTHDLFVAFIVILALAPGAWLAFTRRAEASAQRRRWPSWRSLVLCGLASMGVLALAQGLDLGERFDSAFMAPMASWTFIAPCIFVMGVGLGGQRRKWMWALPVEAILLTLVGVAVMDVAVEGWGPIAGGLPLVLDAIPLLVVGLLGVATTPLADVMSRVSED
jgi:hypothetical protein